MYDIVKRNLDLAMARDKAGPGTHTNWALKASSYVSIVVHI